MSCPHCEQLAPSLEDIFEQCCIAFDQCQAALQARDHKAFMEAREVHHAYADLHAHMSAGGRIH